jgi:MoaA/NifB/PqqE/SkfB family radical SAM enzyme
MDDGGRVKRPGFSRGRAVGQFFASVILGRPRIVFVEVTLRCNARCSFCSYWRDTPVPELPDYAPIVRRFNPVAVALTGGEPLLRRDLCDLVRTIKATGNRFVSVLSNGALLTRERAQALHQAGLDGLSISLNYLDERQDDERQIRGLFRHLSALVPRLRDVGFARLNLNTVLLATNLDQILPLVARAREWGVGVSVSCYSPHKAGDERFVVGPQHDSQVRDVVDGLIQARAHVVSNTEWYLRRIPDYYRTGSLPGCQAGRRTLHVTPDGLVKPCPDLPALVPWNKYVPRRASRPDCDVCWYACRGEVQAPMDLRHMVSLGTFRKSG